MVDTDLLRLRVDQPPHRHPTRRARRGRRRPYPGLLATKLGLMPRPGRHPFLRPDILLMTGEPEVFVETKAREEIQEVRRRRFSVEEYHRMGEAGIFGEGERVELIDGEVVQMNPIGSRHAMCVMQLTRLLAPLIGEQVLVGVQNPVKINGGLEPQLDLMVVRARDYKDSLPGPEDVLLLIEVSDTTSSYDRNVKLPLYAKAGIRESWIVDLAGESIERHDDPSETGYGRMQRVGQGKTLASEAFPDLVLHANAVLG